MWRISFMQVRKELSKVVSYPGCTICEASPAYAASPGRHTWSRGCLCTGRIGTMDYRFELFALRWLSGLFVETQSCHMREAAALVAPFVDGGCSPIVVSAYE